MFGLQRYFDARVEEGASGCVFFIFLSHIFWSSFLLIGPRTLCNACGLVYAKMVRLSNIRRFLPFA